MNPRLSMWVPPAILATGLILASGASSPEAVPLRAPLETVLENPLPGYAGTPVPISDEEIQVAGVTSYFNEIYDPVGAPEGGAAGEPWYSLYVGYYDHQVRGHTIHSPKNCLPGAGWEALDATLTTLDGPDGPVVANRYVLQREDEQVFAYYWYQGRDRIEADEFRVKWNLLWDAAFSGRTDEALVRVVVPAGDDPASADNLAEDVVRWVIPKLAEALPT